jgi:uncharacterized membrane protein
MAFCSGCGAQMADGATICAACGKGQSVGGGAAAAPAATAQGSTMNDNVASAISYFAIIALVFLLIEPFNKNKAVRFHAFQSLILWAACIVIEIVLGFTFILAILTPLVWLASVVTAIICGVKAFQGQKLSLPVIGPIAQKQADAV